jgi:hypothetical protein
MQIHLVNYRFKSNESLLWDLPEQGVKKNVEEEKKVLSIKE